MKRTFLFVLICLFVNISYSQTYNFTFSTSEFSIVENNGKHMIDYPASFNAICNTCDPILPSCVKNILLPPNKKVNNFTVTYTTSNWQSDIILEAMPVECPTDGGDYPNIPCIYDLKVYPDSIVRYGGLSTIDRYQYVSFVITPFVYDPTDGSLSFVSQVNITLELVDNNVTKGIFPTQDRIIKKIVHNPGDVNLFYPKISNRTSVQNIDYLIITADSLKNSFEPLRIWKTQKGVYAKIITIEEITTSYTGATPQIRIKKCVQDYYDNYGLKWLLLGGDNTIVPTLDAYSEVDTYDRIKGEYYTKSESIPADIFYGCFDGAYDWNENGNDTIGETSDNVILSQEVNISRLPIRTSSHVKAYVDKLLLYEKAPTMLTPSMLLCARLLMEYDTITNYSDAHIKSERLIKVGISPYFTGNIVRFYDTHTDFPDGAAYQLNRVNITTQLNNDYDFLHFATHGLNTSWSVEEGLPYMSNHVSALTNSKPMVIATVACHTNAFDRAEPCLSEAFIQKTTGGAVAYLGSSRSAWGSSNLNGFGISFLMNQKFFTYLFGNTSLHFAEIVNLMKSSYTPYSLNKYNTTRWTVLSNNAIGDAELPIYTTIPNKFESITFERNGSNLVVNTGGVEGCTITISDIAEGGCYYATDTNTVSATFTDVPGSCTIVITKDNYIPYIIEPSCVITTEIIDDQRIITGCEETRIGGIEIIGTENETPALGNGMQIPIDSSLIQSIRLGEVKITDIGSLEVINGGTVTIEHLSMEEGAELKIH